MPLKKKTLVNIFSIAHTLSKPLKEKRLVETTPVISRLSEYSRVIYSTRNWATKEIKFTLCTKENVPAHRNQ